MSAGDWMDQAAAYVLGALGPEETRAFEARLAEDAELRAEVAAYERLVGELGARVAAEEPPPALRTRLLDRARTVRPVSAASARPGPAPTRRRSAVVPQWVAWGVAAAGVILAFGLWSTRASVIQERDALRADYREALEALAAADSAAAARDSLLDAIRAGSARMAALADAAGTTTARVFYDPNAGQFAVLASGLPDPPAGRTYQLWAIAEGVAPASVGTFEVRGGGATVRFPASQSVRDLGALDLAALTLEPAGGSPQPTEPPRYVGTWVGPGAALE